MEYLYFECHYQKNLYQDRKNYLTRFHEYYLKYYTILYYTILLYYNIPGVSVKFLMVGESNSMVGYHLMAEDHSIQLGVWERCESPSMSRALLLYYTIQYYYTIIYQEFQLSF